MSRPIHLKEAAKEIGIHKITLLRWFKEGKIKEVMRDRNNWRIFEKRDIEKIKRYANKKNPPPGRKRRNK